MLATLNSKQIVDEIVKEAGNDPHDVLDISSDVVLASRVNKPAPTLAPEFPEPKALDPKALEPKALEPKIQVTPAAAAAAPSVDSAVRATASDLHVARKRSSIGRWLGGAALTFLFALGSAGATILWETHGDTAKQMIATWIPTLMPSPSQAIATPVDQPAAPPVAAADQAAEAAATPQQPAAAQIQDAAPGTAPDAAQSVQAMTRDLAAMTQQIEQLKTNIAELKAGQEQMAREIARPAPPKPAETRAVERRAKLSARPAPPVRKPKPVYSQAYAPAPIAPPPASHAAALPPPSPVAQPQVADDDGPVVRPPMPVH